MELEDRPGAESTELADVLRALAPADVLVGLRAVTAADLAALHEVEAAHVRRAVPDRQHEFATGRALLRALLGQDVPIPVADDRSPILPDGVRGSLAHDREYVVAAVTTAPTVLAVGIDLEPATPLEPEVATLVLRADEAGLDGHLAFTLKEATYKAWSNLGGRLLEHEDIRLSVAEGEFRAEVVMHRATYAGSFAAAAGRWIALVVVRTEDERHASGLGFPAAVLRDPDH